MTSEQITRQSSFIDMAVWHTVKGQFGQPDGREMAIVRDVLFAIDASSGFVDQRLTVIIEIASGPRSGKFASVLLSSLERRY